jgi:hypothetical protein
METKRWGPFSGRQLVVIIVALVAGAVMTPVAVGAATGSVNIEDATNPTRKAKVDANGRLSVDSGLANFSGVGFTAITGGTVTAAPAPTSELFTSNAGIFGSGVLYEPPDGKAAVITAVNLNYNGPSGTANAVSLYVDALNHYIASARFPGVASTYDFTFPTGTPVPEGSQLRADILFPTSASLHAIVSGYLVPASACTTGSTCGY